MKTKWTTGQKVELVIAITCLILCAVLFGDAFDQHFSIGEFKR